MATYKEIKRQIADLERKAQLARKSELSKIISAIKKQIADHDLTVEDLFGGKRGRKPGVKAAKAAGPKKVYPPKYQDPKSGATWTGLGRAPAWIMDAIAKGKKDDFLIEKVSVAAAPKKAKAAPKKAAPAKKAPATAKKAAKPKAVKAEAVPAVAADAS